MNHEAKLKKREYDRIRNLAKRQKRLDSGWVPVGVGSVGTHRMTKTPEYKTWLAMRRRCTNPNDRGFPKYGGRGIAVCDSWMNSFLVFFADMGKRPEGMSLERINNDGSYSKDNCKWATPLEQTRNRRCARIVEENGSAKFLHDLCVEHKAKYTTVYSRLYRSKWPLLRALTEPVKKGPANAKP